MSLFEVNTEELNNLATQLKDFSAFLQEADGIPSVNRSIGLIMTFFGFNLQKYKSNLSAVYATMINLSHDLKSLGVVLTSVAQYAQDADMQAYSVFSGIPTHVLTNVDLIGDEDITRNFLDTRNSTADAVVIALNGTVDNGIGLIGKFVEKASGGNIKIGQTTPEKIMIGSIESLLKASNDVPNELFEKLESLFQKMSPEEYEKFTKIIETCASAGGILTEAKIQDLLQDFFDDNSALDTQLIKKIIDSMRKQDSWKAISDKIDASFGAYKNAFEYHEFSIKITKTIFTDFTEYVITLEAIRTAMEEMGYDNDLVDSCIERMLKNYQEKALSIINDTATLIAEKGLDAAMRTATGGLLQLFDGTWSIASSLTGLQDTTDNLSSVYATQQYSYALVEKYNEYAEKIRSGNFSEGDVQQCNMYFELARNAKIQEYTAIKSLYENALDSPAAYFKNDADLDAAREYVRKLEGEINKLESYSV